MKAFCWNGKSDVSVDQVPEPKIINKQDAIIRVTATTIGASDIYLYNGVSPFMISCGKCFFCKKKLFLACELSNPNEEMAKPKMGHSPAGLFGFSHLSRGFADGQAEFVRVPLAEVDPIKIPNGMPDEKVLFLSDIFPIGYMAAEQTLQMLTKNSIINAMAT